MTPPRVQVAPPGRDPGAGAPRHAPASGPGEAPYRAAVEEDPDLLREIGRVVALWAMVNDLIAWIPRRDRPDDSNEDFFAKGTDRKRIRRVIAATRNAADDAHRKDELEAVLLRLEDLIEERNRIIHGIPARTIERGTGRRFSILTDPRQSPGPDNQRDFPDLVDRHVVRLRGELDLLFDIVTGPVREMLRQHKAEQGCQASRP